jgi:hypothetical protein
MGQRTRPVIQKVGSTFRGQESQKSARDYQLSLKMYHSG